MNGSIRHHEARYHRLIKRSHLRLSQHHTCSISTHEVKKTAFKPAGPRGRPFGPPSAEWKPSHAPPRSRAHCVIHGDFPCSSQCRMQDREAHSLPSHADPLQSTVTPGTHGTHGHGQAQLMYPNFPYLYLFIAHLSNPAHVRSRSNLCESIYGRCRVFPFPPQSHCFP
jgi:hypothetical protein